MLADCRAGRKGPRSVIERELVCFQEHLRELFPAAEPFGCRSIAEFLFGIPFLDPAFGIRHFNHGSPGERLPLRSSGTAFNQEVNGFTSMNHETREFGWSLSFGGGVNRQ